MELKIKRLLHGPVSYLPGYETQGAAGFDLRAAIYGQARINAGSRALIPTGFAVAVPDGYELQIRSRSGLSLNHGIMVANSPGTIDSDYRGEIKIILHNSSDAPYYVQPHERIAQAVLAPVVRAQFVEVDELDETVRGDGGFGSTGV